MGNQSKTVMKRLTAELSALFAQSHTLESEIRANLKTIGYELPVAENSQKS